MDTTDEQESEHTAVVGVLAETSPRSGFTEGTLERLSDACTVAKKLGGKVRVWLLLGPEQDLPDKNTLLSHGADQLRVLRHPGFEVGDSGLVARALAAEQSQDIRLLLLPGNAPGEEAASMLAEELSTTWIPDVLTLNVTRKGVLCATAVLPGGKLSREYRSETEPVVATMRDGVAETRPLPTCPDEMTTTEKSLPNDILGCGTRVERDLPARPESVDIRFANKIVAVGRGAGDQQGVEMLSELARELEASLAASRVAVDLGWTSQERQVGQTGRTVRPDLYVAAGISGASHHLLGMRDSRHIVAINPDEDAPIHDVAHLSLFGDLHQIVPEIRRLLEKERA